MPLTLDLPAHLEADLREEAAKEGLQPTEHAALLVAIFTALLREVETTPFRIAIQTFLSHRSIDAEQVSSVLEELVGKCIVNPKRSTSASYLRHPLELSGSMEDVYANLSLWRNSLVHQPIDQSLSVLVAPRQHSTSLVQQSGRAAKRVRALGKYAHVGGSSDDFAQQKREEVAREDRSRQ